MSKLDLCRACLSHDTQMNALTSTRYKQIYEKNTGAKLIIGKGRPDKVCNNCNMQLQSFLKFLEMSKKTEKYLSDTYKSGVELLQEKLSELARDLECITESTSDSNAAVASDEEEEATTAPSNETQDVAIKIEAVDYEEEIDLVENTDSEPEILSVDNYAYKIQNANSSKQSTYILEDHSYSKHALEIESPIEDDDTQNDSEEDSTIGEYNLTDVTVQLERIPIAKYQLRSQKASKLKTKTPEETQMYSCEECNYKCQFKSIMEKHIKVHKSNCKSRNQTGSSLKSSERNAILKRGECDKCGKVFSKAQYLLRHKQLHTRVYTCKMCNREFNHKSTFLVHTRTHTGEKPFACKVCVKTFNDKSNCRKHMKTHTGTAGHACFMCDQVFSKRSRLKEHAIEHIL